MADERWARVSEIYNDAVTLAPVDRAAFLRKACGGDEALRAEIESLLGDDSRVTTLLEPKGSHTARIGQRNGSYEIRALLGVGGMGEVYRARIPSSTGTWQLNPPVGFAADGERLARFQRESAAARIIQSPPYRRHSRFRRCVRCPRTRARAGRGRHAGRATGEGRIPTSEALYIARQIAEALDTAHEHGVIHRDLKPANIKITPESHEGARLRAGQGGSRPESPPLQTTALSHEGIVVTAQAYMSPSRRAQSLSIGVQTSGRLAACWTRCLRVASRSRLRR